MADTVGYFIKQHAIPKNANKNTRRSYKRAAEHFQEYCSQVAHVSLKRMRSDNAVAVTTIQAYSDALQSAGKSPDTIHTYLAPVCKAFEVPMNEILKPRRRAGKITRSGLDKNGGKLRNARGTREAAMERYARSVALADATGIRASELAHLTVANLVEDESGHLCVEVDRGKGGKHQLQRILPAHQETVRQIFAQASSTGGGKVLGNSEISKNIDYHGRRAIVAQKAYRYYLTRLQADPAYRQQLQRELLARWEHERPENIRSLRRGSTTQSHIACGGMFGIKQNSMGCLLNGIAQRFWRCPFFTFLTGEKTSPSKIIWSNNLLGGDSNEKAK